MPTLRAALGVLIGVALAGCSGEPSPAGSDPVVVGMGGGGQVDAGAEGDASGDSGQSVLYASIVAETEPGDAPAEVVFVNESSQVLSLWVEQAWFDGIEAFATSGPQLAASKTLRHHSQVGFHQGDFCFTLRFKEITGPDVLVPGHAYAFAATADPVDGYFGFVTDQGPKSFTGLRARMFDPAGLGASPAQLRIDLSSGGELSFQSYETTPTAYQAASAEVVALTFTSTTGQVFSSDIADPIATPEAPGFTVWVDDAPIDGAIQVVTLASTGLSHGG